MKNNGRYDASGAEAEFEAGSRRRVLRNLRGIRSVREMEQAESEALIAVEERLVARFSRDHCFTADDIRELHREWLGGIYSWAGEYRNLNIAKGGFHFAAASRVPGLMTSLEKEQLTQLTPCRSGTHADVAKALAIVHAELVLIHPFREGNGRCARLLSVLMALQAGLPPLEFDDLARRGKRRYIAAIHAAMSSNYEPMIAVFKSVIARTLHGYGQKNEGR